MSQISNFIVHRVQIVSPDSGNSTIWPNGTHSWSMVWPTLLSGMMVDWRSKKVPLGGSTGLISKGFVNFFIPGFCKILSIFLLLDTTVHYVQIFNRCLNEYDQINRPSTQTREFKSFTFTRVTSFSVFLKVNLFLVTTYSADWVQSGALFLR